MSDSLLNDLDAAVEAGFQPTTNTSRPPHKAFSQATAQEVLRRADIELYRSKLSLLDASAQDLDYDGFVRLLASSPVPLASRFTREPGPIGSGWTWTVYRGRMFVHGGVTAADVHSRVVAIKELNVDLALGLSSVEERMSDYKTKMASVLLEIRLMSHELLRNHRNIVQLYGIGWTTRRLVAGQEPCHVPVLLTELSSLYNRDPLSLEHLIRSNAIAKLTVQAKTMLLADVAAGLMALHALSVVHGDLKPANVLIFDYGADTTAKIIDFGFSSTGDQELQAVRGGTPDWNAPECLPLASESMSRYRYEATRDLYSFGLLIWFVLFEELPTETYELKPENRNKKLDLKDEIDAKYAKHFRVTASATETKGIIQEEYNASSQTWQPSLTSEQHILRFLLQWLLVTEPKARQNSLDLYGSLLKDKTRLPIAQSAFETPGEWDLQWHKYGRSQVRFQDKSLLEDKNTTLYAVPLGKELANYGNLRHFDNLSPALKIHNLASKNIPMELRKHMFESYLRRAGASDQSAQSDAEKSVADCYFIGFGVEADVSTAVDWYRKAAVHGHTGAIEAYIELKESDSAKQELGIETYCQWLCRILLSVFDNAEESSSAQKNNMEISRLQCLLCLRPEHTVLALEEGSRLLSEYRNLKQHGVSSLETSSSGSWKNAVDAIERDDQMVLRQVIRENSSILQGLPDGQHSLAYVAVANNRAGILRMLIEEYKADYQLASTDDGLTPLAYAIRHGHTSSARILTSSNSDATVEDATAAMDIGSSGDNDLTAFLFEKFAGSRAVSSSPDRDVRTPGSHGRWSLLALASAIVNNNWPVFCTLLSIGADPNITTPPDISTPESFFAAILLASTSYNPLMVAALLAFGANLNVRIPKPDCRTALHLSCGPYFTTDFGREPDEERADFTKHWRNRRPNVPPESRPQLQRFLIDLLLECGADTEVRDYDGLTPLAYSIQHCNDFEAASYLLQQRLAADIDAPDFSGATALHRAVENQDTHKVDFILRNGASVDAQNFMGETPLCKAVKQGDQAMCRRLLRAGAQIRAADANGQNCLHVALQHTQLEIVQMFEAVLRAHSDLAFEQVVLDRDCRGWTALHTCILKSATESRLNAFFQRWILSMPQLDMDMQDGLGYTLVHMAALMSAECARFLLQHEASVDVKDTILGWTPLHHVAFEGNFDMLNLLLEFGADSSLRDDYMGWTPLQLLDMAMDELRLQSGETWEAWGENDDDSTGFEDEESHTIEENDVWEDEDPDIPIRTDVQVELEQQETHSAMASYASTLDPIARERLARRRSRIRARIALLTVEESQRRLARSMSQNLYDIDVSVAQAAAFPEHQYLEATSPEMHQPLRSWNARNLERITIVDKTGRVRGRYIRHPILRNVQCDSKVWSMDASGVVQGLDGLG